MSVTYLRHIPCNQCGCHRYYKRSERCVNCVAVINSRYKTGFTREDLKRLEAVAMAGVEYADEERVRI